MTDSDTFWIKTVFRNECRANCNWRSSCTEELKSYLWLNFRKPQLYVTEKVLRFAQRQLESSQSNSCSCALQGSIAVDQGRHGLSARISSSQESTVFVINFIIKKVKYFGRKCIQKIPLLPIFQKKGNTQTTGTCTLDVKNAILLHENTSISCIILFLDGEGVTFVLDRFDPGGGGTISCSGLTPGDISVPFEVRHRELALAITRKEKHSFFKDINCSYNLMFVLIILVYTFLYILYTDVWKHKRNSSWFTKWLL